MSYAKMPQKITVHVTEQDIDRGKENNAYWCPIALALSGQGWINTAEVRTSYVTVTRIQQGNIELRYGCNYPLPQAAMDFIYRFDAGKEQCYPFTFDLEQIRE